MKEKNRAQRIVVTEEIKELEAAVNFFESQSKMWNPHIKPLLRAGERDLERLKELQALCR